MAKSYKLSTGNEYIVVTADDGGAYIIKDMAGRKVFLSEYQAKLMKFGIDNLLKEARAEENVEVKIEELEK